MFIGEWVEGKEGWFESVALKRIMVCLQYGL